MFEVGDETFPAASDDSPWFDGCENKILQSLNLDGTFNQITGIAWDSDGWQDENGGWWKTVKATGNRMIKRSRAWFLEKWQKRIYQWCAIPVVMCRT